MNMSHKKIPADKDAANEWFTHRIPQYEALVVAVKFCLETLLRDSAIDFLSVAGRAKTRKSFLEKIDRKSYANFEEDMTDLAGLRIIVFIESDVKRACELIKQSFYVHEDKSLNKSDELSSDRMGYRSFHLICDLGDKRAELKEYMPYKGLMFEIQVRTVLQHAWAEIEHDRNYKLSGKLPEPLARRLNLIAGLLELADREFNAIASEVESYDKDVAADVAKGVLDEEITTLGVKRLLIKKLKEAHITFHVFASMNEIPYRLAEFGATTLADVDALLNTKFLETFKKHTLVTTSLPAIINKAMLCDSPKKYITLFHRGHKMVLSNSLYSLIKEMKSKEEFAQLQNVITLDKG